MVQDKADADVIQVRARVKKDLQRLARFAAKAGGIEMPAVISTPEADYAYRIIVDRAAWETIGAALTADIDYTNFKSTVHGESDRDATYMLVWSMMNELQRRRQKSREG